MVRLCRMQQTFDRPMTRIVSCKSNLPLAYDCRIRHKKCCRILKRFKILRQLQVKAVLNDVGLCDFLHDVSSACSTNRMRQS